MQSWTPNTPLQNGQYIIKRAIGGGGFGETYLAEDTEENSLVAGETHLIILKKYYISALKRKNI
jgi:serine/threonine protein kinase